MRKSISRKLNKVVSVIIALAMVVTMFSITPAFSKRVSASMEISFSGPSVEAGLSTWNCVYFGSYYQENDTVKLPIKWRILENSDDSLLLLADKDGAFGLYGATEAAAVELTHHIAVAASGSFRENDVAAAFLDFLSHSLDHFQGLPYILPIHGERLGAGNDLLDQGYILQFLF